MDEDSIGRPDDRTRPCPDCRMEVSILATKCRYCGSELGRPREETRKLSISDMGGETIKHYAPSHNVMGAIESFRKGTLEDEGEEDAGADLHGIGAQRAGFGSAIPSSIRRVKHRSGRWGNLLRYVLMALVGVAIAYAGYRYLPGILNPPPEPDTFVNRAPQLIESGAPPIEVLEAAIEGVRHDTSEQNAEYAEQARGMVVEQVYGLLNASPWSREHLEQASYLAKQAIDIDASPALQRLKQMVDQEYAAYQVLLLHADSANDTAVFKLNSPGISSEVTVHEGDVLGERFEVVSITSSHVRLRDLQRDRRPLLCSVGGVPKSGL